MRYPTDVEAAAPDGWITVAAAEDMRAAAREAAFVYREREHPDDSYPDQLRIRSVDEIRRSDGDEALADAMDSLHAFARLTATPHT